MLWLNTQRVIIIMQTNIIVSVCTVLLLNYFFPQVISLNPLNIINFCLLVYVVIVLTKKELVANLIRGDDNRAECNNTSI
jgi:hypothetical protein